MGEACITLDMAALAHNVSQIQQKAPDSRVLAMVKANAYGHGMVKVAKALLGNVSYFGVATLAEGIELSQQLPRERPDIVVMRGPRSAEEAQALVNHRLDCVIHHMEQITWLARLPAKPLMVWLKINSGMNRLGFDLAQFPQVLKRLEQCAAAKNIVLLSHLGTANSLSCQQASAQIMQFETVTKAFPYPKSFANSAALLHYPKSHLDIVRPGLLIYGISTVSAAKALNLKPVMTFSAPIIDIQTVQPGQWVGYSATWQAKQPTKIAIVGAGYANGYPMHMPSGSPILLQGQRTQTIGQVSMDMLAVDITDFDQVAIGDSAMLWGGGLSAEEVASCAAISPYALVTGVRAAFS